ncbi:MAG: PadR family transcriptional regulator [Gemmatimonadota bacterium]|nr:PadR family transcriptional regulator [Gemmatimonadota bacterium]
MSGEFLGEFEQMVLLSIMRLGDDAYGLAVRDELEAVAGRSPSSGALYTTLDRMERKGLLTSREGESTGDRGGRPRRYVEVTSAGKALLAHSRHTLLALWDGLEGALDR